MSWDIHLTINTGGKEYKEIGEGKNYTYNVAPMFYKAFDIEGGLKGINGMLGDEAIGYLEHAINQMKVYENVNPENFWGNYEGALRLLEWLLHECVQNPLAKVNII